MEIKQDDKVKALIKRFVESNDKDAFAEIYELYINDVYRFVYSRIGNVEVTQDIVSDTFFILVDIVHKFNGNSKFTTFLFGIANNKILQYFNQQKKEHSVKLDEELIAEKEDQQTSEHVNNLLKNIEVILAKLPKRYRTVLVERFINQKSVKATADELNISEVNVRVIQNRALKKAQVIANQYKVYGKEQ